MRSGGRRRFDAGESGPLTLAFSARPSFNPVAMGSNLVRSIVCALALSVFPLAAVAQMASDPAVVRLRAGDAVRLEVRDEPNLAGEFRVDDAGRVLLPLVGIVAIAGRDFAEVRHEVEARYAQELHNREIRLTPLVRIAVLGEVRTPGLYPVDPTMTLGDVIALAGGLGPEANRDRIELVRGGAVVVVAKQLDPTSLGRRLESGDQVMVARRSWVKSNSGSLIGAAGSLVVAVITTLLLR